MTCNNFLRAELLQEDTTSALFDKWHIDGSTLKGIEISRN